MFHRLTDAFTFFFEADHFKIYELVLKNSKLKVRWNLSCGTFKGHLYSGDTKFGPEKMST